MPARQSLADIQFLLNDVLQAPAQWQALAPLADTDGALAAQVLDEGRVRGCALVWTSSARRGGEQIRLPRRHPSIAAHPRRGRPRKGRPAALAASPRRGTPPKATQRGVKTLR
jgi:hypothetical protein